MMKAYPAWRVNGNWAFANSGYTAAQNGINGDIIRDSLLPALDVIAASRPAQVAKVVDLHAPFDGPTQVFAPDGVHPNRQGHDSIARVLYRWRDSFVIGLAFAMGHFHGREKRDYEVSVHMPPPHLDGYYMWDWSWDQMTDFWPTALFLMVLLFFVIRRKA